MALDDREMEAAEQLFDRIVASLPRHYYTTKFNSMKDKEKFKNILLDKEKMNRCYDYTVLRDIFNFVLECRPSTLEKKQIFYEVDEWYNSLIELNEVIFSDDKMELDDKLLLFRNNLCSLKHSDIPGIENSNISGSKLTMWLTLYCLLYSKFDNKPRTYMMLDQGLSNPSIRPYIDTILTNIKRVIDTNDKKTLYNAIFDILTIDFLGPEPSKMFEGRMNSIFLANNINDDRFSVPLILSGEIYFNLYDINTIKDKLEKRLREIFDDYFDKKNSKKNNCITLDRYDLLEKHNILEKYNILNIMKGDLENFNLYPIISALSSFNGEPNMIEILEIVLKYYQLDYSYFIDLWNKEREKSIKRDRKKIVNKRDARSSKDKILEFRKK